MAFEGESDVSEASGTKGLDGAHDDDFDSSPRRAKRRKVTGAASTKTKPPAAKKPTTARKSRAEKKVAEEDPILDDEDAEDAFDPPIPAAKPKRKPRKKALAKVAEGAVEEPDETLGKSTKGKRKSTGRASVDPDVSDEYEVDSDDFVKPKKPKHRIHIPVVRNILPEVFLDQEPPESSAPWSIRGPIWRKDVLDAAAAAAKPRPFARPIPPPKPVIRTLPTKLNVGPKVTEYPGQDAATSSRPPSVRGITSRPTGRDAPTLPPPPPEPRVQTAELWETGEDSDDIDAEDLMLLETDVPQSRKTAASNAPSVRPHQNTRPPLIQPASSIYDTGEDSDDIDAEDLMLLESGIPQISKPAATAGLGARPLQTATSAPAQTEVTDLDDILDGNDDDLEDVMQLRTEIPRTALAGSANASASRSIQKAPQPLRQNDLPMIDIADELADLPSDAFDSDHDFPAKATGDPIYISSQTVSKPPKPNLAPPRNGLRQTTLTGGTVQPMSAASQANKRAAWPMATQKEPATHHVLDQEAIKTWVYPTNLGTTRDYQYNIVARGLFHNLLVALPTGLGKTFIAATIMLNWFRWTKSAQIVFVAPTKPLVAQQIDACFHIVGIPRSQTVMLTGTTAPGHRAKEWESKRVFFMTPQTIINDLKKGICDPKRIVLVVVDEAHRATGNYAYVEVVKFIRRFNQSFRVLALTATPGPNVDAVQQVINGLDISRVEIRTETSLDIRQYVHSRDIDSIKFDYSEEQQIIMELASSAIRPVLNKLAGVNAYWNRDPMKLSAYACTLASRQWYGSDAGKKASGPVKAMVQSIFRVIASLGHSISLLKFHGIGPFYQGMVGFRNDVDGGSMKGKYGTQIREDENFTKMMNMMQTWTRNADFLGHPKLEYLRRVVLNHFLDAGESTSTRIMIFAHWRESAEEIVRVLKRNEPMIRPHVFVGQADSKGSEGMGQKRQLEVIQQFKEGKYNTLVATSIGEEGLDIGEVDLIVCYDASASPIRMLQRMGRTGRKRKGNIVLLLMRDKEEGDFEKAKDNYEKMQGMIASGNHFEFHDDRSRRIVPREVQPEVDKRVVEIPVENSQAELPEPTRRGRVPKMPPKKFHMPDNVKTGFVRASKMDGDDDDEEEEEIAPRGKAKAKAKRSTTFLRQKSSTPEPKTAPVPYLDDVVLNKVQERELERKYQYVQDADDKVPTVAAPRLDSFPRIFPGPIRYVRHGQGTLEIAATMQRIRDVDDSTVQRFKDNLHVSDLEDDVCDLVGEPNSEELPTASDLPTTVRPSKTKKATPKSRTPKVPKEPRASKVAKAPRAPKAPKGPGPATTPKPRGRAKKTTRKDSSDMEGASSSPEPTPANMRLGTQGIDLGSDDTVGEEGPDDTEQDSELEDFVVGSDAPIEFVSSSLPPTQYGTERGREAAVSSERSGQGDSESDTEIAAVRRNRRRQVVEDDSDE